MKTSLLTTSSVIAFLTMGQAALAQTEEAPADTVARQDTVYVTATRREETVQNAPINIAAVGGPQIEEQGLTELADLIATVPGINVVDRGGRQGNPIIVRGLNADPIGPGDGDNSGGGTVATYLGEVPLFIDLKLNDMERVEVLLGPQGTLYGAGTLAGAIRYIPVKPQFESDMLELRGGAYMYSEAEDISTDVGFTFNKSFSDTFAIRGSLDVLNDSGFVDQPFLVREVGVSNPDPDFSDPEAVAANLMGAEDVDSEDAISGRIAARWTPTDWLDGTLTYYYQDVEVGGRRISSAPATYDYDGPQELFSAGKYENAKRIPEPNKITNDLLALEVTADLGFAELTSATGYSTFEDDGNRDQNDLLISLEYSYELFPSFGSRTHEVGENETFTQEVRLVSTYESAFNWIVGGFFSEFESAGYSAEYTPNYDTWAIENLGGADWGLVDRPDDLEYFSVGHLKLKETAIFGEIGYDITDKWRVTAGARWYDYELKEGASSDLPLFDLDFVPMTVDEIWDLEFDPDAGQADDGMLYKFNTSYQFTPDILGYFTISEGYRIGNSNGVAPCEDYNADDPVTQSVCALSPGQQYGPDADDVAQFDERQYGPDKTVNYEIGAKTAWLDGDVILNGAVYYIEWSDPQVSSATILGSQPITINASGAESKGFELQGAWSVNENFDLRGSFSHSSASLTADVPALIRSIDPPGYRTSTIFIDGEDGDRLPGAPENKFSIFGSYKVDVPNGDYVMLNGGYNWQGDILTRAGGRAGSATIPSVGTANISATYIADDWEASLFVKNLFDEYVVTGYVSAPRYSQVVSDFDGNPVTYRGHYATLGAPRTIGVNLKYRFGE